MRDTKYAQELASVAVGHSRLEKLLIKESGKEEIRLSWLPEGKMALRPLDLPENELLELFSEGIRAKIFSANFIRELNKITK
jgi:hypothetical protein